MKRALPPAGFTLLEIIATIVLVGIVATMGVSFFSSGVTRTDVAITQLQADANLQLVLENMIADKLASFNTNLTGMSNNIGAVNSTQSAYGGGNSYYIADKRFVCPNATNVFQTNASADQFLLVTIKSNVNSGTSLSYLFSSSMPSTNCNAGGS